MSYAKTRSNTQNQSFLSKFLNSTTNFINNLQHKLEERERENTEKLKRNKFTPYTSLIIKSNIKYIGGCIITPDNQNLVSHIPEALEILSDQIHVSRFDGYKTSAIKFLIKEDHIALMDKTNRFMFKEIKFEHMIWFGTNNDYSNVFGVIVRVKNFQSGKDNSNQTTNKNSINHSMINSKNSKSTAATSNSKTGKKPSPNLARNRKYEPKNLANRRNLSTIPGSVSHNDSNMNGLTFKSTPLSASSSTLNQSTFNPQYHSKQHHNSTPNLSVLEANARNSNCIYLFKTHKHHELLRILRTLNEVYRKFVGEKFEEFQRPDSPGLIHQPLTRQKSEMHPGKRYGVGGPSNSSNPENLNLDQLGNPKLTANYLPPLSVQDHLNKSGVETYSMEYYQNPVDYSANPTNHTNKSSTLNTRTVPINSQNTIPMTPSHVPGNLGPVSLGQNSTVLDQSFNMASVSRQEPNNFQNNSLNNAELVNQLSTLTALVSNLQNEIQSFKSQNDIGSEL